MFLNCFNELFLQPDKQGVYFFNLNLPFQKYFYTSRDCVRLTTKRSILHFFYL